MLMKNNNVPEPTGNSVTVNVDVTRIVKYICVAGIVIVGIIFGTKCSEKLISKEL